jgi:hypothetical protein
MPIADISVGGVAEVVAQQINHRTWGRIHRLKVEQTGDGLRVRGETSSHYLKQLALLGAKEAIGLAAPLGIELDIRVARR